MTEVISLRGPIEKIDGKLVLLIPLDQGGKDLAASAQGIGGINGEYLEVTIPEWLADRFSIHEGSFVTVNNDGGTFNIFPSDS